MVGEGEGRVSTRDVQFCGILSLGSGASLLVLVLILSIGEGCEGSGCCQETGGEKHSADLGCDMRRLVKMSFVERSSKLRR